LNVGLDPAVASAPPAAGSPVVARANVTTSSSLKYVRRTSPPLLMFPILMFPTGLRLSCPRGTWDAMDGSILLPLSPGVKDVGRRLKVAVASVRQLHKYVCIRSSP